MDLQLQQMFQRRPNRPTQQFGQPQQFNRPQNIQRGQQFQSPQPRQQHQYRGQQQQPQQQMFDQDRPQQRGNYRYQGSQQEYQGMKRQDFNQQYNRNQGNQFQQQSYNNYQGQQNQFRGQRQNQQKTYQTEGQQPRFPKPGQQFDQYQSRPPRQQSYNFNEDRSYSPQENTRPSQGFHGIKGQYQKRSQQQEMQNNMNQFIAQQFHSREGQFRGRGRGRGRGSRGRQNGSYRVQNQHQRPYQSEIDREQTQKRLQKFKPQPILKPRLQQQNKKKIPFIRQDKQSISHSIQQSQSESQYSQQQNESQSVNNESHSKTYSEYSDNREQVESVSRSNEQQQQYSQANGEQQEQGEQSGEMNKQQQSQMQQQLLNSHPYIAKQDESIAESYTNDISTAAINDMCSKDQFYERLATFDSNNRQTQHSKLRLDTSRSFSIFQINKKTLKPDYTLALKRFKRSADRAEGQEKEDTKDRRRSVKALVKVMNHINKEIIDADNVRDKDLAFPLPPGEPAFQFIHIYDFLWDRMREMIKDITRLSPKQKMTKEIITICEQIARFFILSINEGRKKYNSKLKFDERMNTESIIKVISDLMNSYRESRMDLRNIIQNLSDEERQTITIEQIQKLMQAKGIYLSPYEPELSAYSFLFSDNRKKEFYQILTVGFQDQETQSDNPLFNSLQMQKALTVHRILNERNIEKYFEQLQNNDTDYLFSCMMLKNLQKMRKQTSQMLFKSHNFYKNDNTSVKSAMLSETLRKTLRFPKKQTEEFNEFIDALGVKIEGKLLIWRQGALNEDHYIIPEYVFEHEKTNRKDWIDTQCKKHIKNSNSLSRQELIKSSWRKSNYREQIITFYLGRELGKQRIIPKPIKVLKQIPPAKQIEPQPTIVAKQKSPEEAAIDKQKEVKHLLMLNEMRKGIQKKAKRTKFLQKLQTQILQLYRHTDQAKIINRKKSLAMIDQWLMYYQDKMLKISFEMIHYECNKKNLMRNMLLEMKTYAVLRKKFNDQFNQSSYQFEPTNSNSIIPERTERGVMSGLLAKAQFKAKKISCNTFEQYLDQNNHFTYPMNLNFLILTTCSISPQNEKVLFDTILYFVQQRDGNHFMKRKHISQAINSLKSKDKEVSYMRVCFDHQNVNLNLRIAKINEVKSKRKAIIQNSHVIQHIFGCHGLILIRDNLKYQATQTVLQSLQQFISNKSRIYQGTTDEDEDRYKIDTLTRIELPILSLNVWKKSTSVDQGKNSSNILSKINKQKYPYLVNFNEVVVMEGSTQSENLPFLLRQQLKKHLTSISAYYQLQQSIIFTINPLLSEKNIQNFTNKEQKENFFTQRSLKELFREIRVNSSIIEEKLNAKIAKDDLEIKKKFIFCYYQEYFNICLDQIIQESSNCFKNSIFFKKWPKQLLKVQNILTDNDLKKKTSPQENTQIDLNDIQEDQLIANTLDSQTDYNLILETFKEYEFTKRICEQLKMKFVGQNIQPIETKYMILDDQPVNIFGMTKKVSKNQQTITEKQKILHLTHFINTIGKYLNLFDPKKSFADDKFQNLYSVFQQYGLQFRTVDVGSMKMSQRKQQKSKQQAKEQDLIINYQIEGASLQFFSYLIGYLMDGCKNITILLPLNFRFKLNIDDFIAKSQLNLKNVLKLMRQKRKDIFDELKDSQYKPLSQLVIRQLGYQVDATREIILKRIQQEKKRIVINCDEDVEQQEEMEVGQEQQYMQKCGEKKVSLNELNQTYINGTYELSPKRIYPYFLNDQTSGFHYSRMDMLDQLKKKVKC